LPALRAAFAFFAGQRVAALLQRALQDDRPRTLGGRALSRRRRGSEARHRAAYGL